MGKGKTFFTKNNPNYVGGPVVSDTPRADANNTLKSKCGWFCRISRS
jgi:hypothetical protein